MAKRRSSFFPPAAIRFSFFSFPAYLIGRLSRHLNLNFESHDFNVIIWINAGKLVDDNDTDTPQKHWYLIGRLAGVLQLVAVYHLLIWA